MLKELIDVVVRACPVCGLLVLTPGQMVCTPCDQDVTILVKEGTFKETVEPSERRKPL